MLLGIYKSILGLRAVMNKRLLSVLVSGLLAFAVSAGPGAYAADGAKDPEERVCYKVKDTGSHAPRRICKKRRQWEKIARDAKKAAARSSGS